MDNYIPLTGNHYLQFVMSLCRIAYGKMTVRLLWDIGLSSPRKGIVRPSDCAFFQALKAAKFTTAYEINTYQKSLTIEEQKIWEQSGMFESAICDAIPRAKLFKLVNQFFVDFYNTDDLEREKIENAFSDFLSAFVKGNVFLVLLADKRNIPRSHDERMDAELLLDDFDAYVEGADATDINDLWQNAGGTA